MTTALILSPMVKRSRLADAHAEGRSEGYSTGHDDACRVWRHVLSTLLHDMDATPVVQAALDMLARDHSDPDGGVTEVWRCHELSRTLKRVAYVGGPDEVTLAMELINMVAEDRY